MASTTEITLEQLASVDAKMLFKALEMRLASAGVIKKRGSKKASAKSSSSDDDAASEASVPRSVGEGTKKWNDKTKVVAALVKEALAGEKGGAGFHLKVLSFLKTEKGLDAEAEPTLEQVAEAVTYLKANPDWVSPNQKAKAAKAKPSEEPSSPVASSAVKVVVKKAEEAPKKKGRPAKSAEEKEAEATAKKAAKEEEAAAKKAAKKAEKDAEAASKKSSKKMPSSAKKAEPAKAEAEEEADSELVEIELEGVGYFWDAEGGAVFENIDGHTGERIGSWNGTDADINRDE